MKLLVLCLPVVFAAVADTSSMGLETLLDSELAKVSSYVYRAIELDEPSIDFVLAMECALIDISHAKTPTHQEEEKLAKLRMVIAAARELILSKGGIAAILETHVNRVQTYASMFLSLPSVMRYLEELNVALHNEGMPYRFKQRVLALREVLQNVKQLDILRPVSLSLYDIDAKLSAVEDIFSVFNPSLPLPIQTVSAIGNMLVWHAHMKRAIRDGYSDYRPRLKRLEIVLRDKGMAAILQHRKVLNLPIATPEAPVDERSFTDRDSQSEALNGFSSFYMDKSQGELFGQWSALVGMSFMFEATVKEVWDDISATIDSAEMQWSSRVVPDVAALFAKPSVTLEALVSRKIDSKRLALGRS